jgi:hypothetical protein
MRLLTLCAGLSRSWRKWIAVRESPDCPALTQKGDRFICGGKGRKEMVSRVAVYAALVLSFFFFDVRERFPLFSSTDFSISLIAVFSRTSACRRFSWGFNFGFFMSTVRIVRPKPHDITLGFKPI